MGQKTYTETEKKDSWMSADVEIRYTGKVDGGLARLQMVVTSASIASQDRHGKMVENPIDETDRYFVFTQTTHGEVYEVEFPGTEKPFLVTLKKKLLQCTTWTERQCRTIRNWQELFVARD